MIRPATAELTGLAEVQVDAACEHVGLHVMLVDDDTDLLGIEVLT